MPLASPAVTPGEARAAPAALPLLLLALVLVHAGLALPDIDQRIPFLGHRSALTHSVLVAIPIFMRWPAVGGLLAGGIAVHLAADLMVRGWYGYALVKLPLLGALGGAESQIFLAVNVAAGLAMYQRVPAEPLARRLLWVLLVVAAVAYFLDHEGWWPLVLGAMGLAAAAGWWLRAR